MTLMVSADVTGYICCIACNKYMMFAFKVKLQVNYETASGGKVDAVHVYE